MKAFKEYKTLSTIKDKLAFDPAGRPGAPLIREDQERLTNLKRDIKQRTKHNIRSANSVYTYRTQEARLFNYVNQCEIEAYKENDLREGSPRQLLGLAMESNVFKTFGPWFVRSYENKDKDYHYYSKAWHRSYGPKITTARFVKFARIYRGKPLIKTIEVPTFSGDYIVNAGIKEGIFKPVKSKYALKIRLKNVFDAKILEQTNDFRIYSRTLLNSHYDYVIECKSTGVIYHDKRKGALKPGLDLKIQAKTEAAMIEKGELINWSFCKKLGFCDTGLNAFCELFGFDTDSAYTPDQIAKRVMQNPGKAAPFESELKTLAEKVGYKIAI